MIDYEYLRSQMPEYVNPYLMFDGLELGPFDAPTLQSILQRRIELPPDKPQPKDIIEEFVNNGGDEKQLITVLYLAYYAKHRERYRPRFELTNKQIEKLTKVLKMMDEVASLNDNTNLVISAILRKYDGFKEQILHSIRFEFLYNRVAVENGQAGRKSNRGRRKLIPGQYSELEKFKYLLKASEIMSGKIRRNRQATLILAMAWNIYSPESDKGRFDGKYKDMTDRFQQVKKKYSSI